jgi:hypothetical protein
MYQGKKEILVNTNFITSLTKQLSTVILNLLIPQWSDYSHDFKSSLV